MMYDKIFGNVGGCSPCNADVSIGDDFITDDSLAISTYNTNVFCEVGGVTVPVYSNLSNIPLNLPDRTMIKVTDDAYPSKSRQINVNFRLKNYPWIGDKPTGESSGVGLFPWSYLFVAIITVVSVGFVIAMIRSLILVWLLPGGPSGQERQITPTVKLITNPDGSWDLWDTETNTIIKSGSKPDWTGDIIIMILLGVAGIAGIYVFVKHGVPYLVKTVKGSGEPG